MMNKHLFGSAKVALAMLARNSQGNSWQTLCLATACNNLLSQSHYCVQTCKS